MTLTSNIIVCQRCDYRAKTWTPPKLPCTVDGRDIIEHARQGDCFYDFFRTRALEAQLIEQGVPVQKPANEPGGCGC